MICGICQEQESKYKCPKCKIPYCSLTCYKSESHTHKEEQEEQEEPKVEVPSTHTNTGNDDIKEDTDKFSVVVNDPQIKSMLREPALQIHLLTIVKLLNDDSLIQGNVNYDQRLEIVRLKLQDLRVGGIEENELVEEFIQRVLQLLNE
ncbi:Protein HIT1 [Spathaspora sp. JA1]|nr:Protein HIT1 [Spathaspora sp. JA1]